MLKIRNLYAYYGSVTALSGVTCHVRPGEVVCLIGGNGAGKTTLLNAVCGLVRREGQIIFDGRPITGLTPEAIVALGISQVPEGRQLFAAMTVAENLDLGAYLRHRRHPPGGDSPGPGAGLRPVPPPPGSPGPKSRDHERRRAADAGHRQGSDGPPPAAADGRALLWVWLPRWWRILWPPFCSLRREGGLTILLVEQNARATLKVADRGYVLETGHLILSGAAADLLQDRQVVYRAYLGKDYREFTEGR